MTVEKCYKYKKDGIVYVSRNVPEGTEVLEELNILCASKGYDIIRKHDEKNMGSSVLLLVGDLVDNYEEIEHEQGEINDN